MRIRPLPPMVTEIVTAALIACDRTEYYVHGSCSHCGGTLSGYDRRSKRFAVLCDEETDRPVSVILHRSYCRECGRIHLPEEPFYPGTRVGSPVVDLCQALAGSVTYGRVSVILSQMGVRVDRWSVRSYVARQRIPVPTVFLFGMMIPVSIVSLSTLGRTDKPGVPPRAEDVLAACYFPSRKIP